MRHTAGKAGIACLSVGADQAIMHLYHAGNIETCPDPNHQRLAMCRCDRGHVINVDQLVFAKTKGDITKCGQLIDDLSLAAEAILDFARINEPR